MPRHTPAERAKNRRQAAPKVSRRPAKAKPKPKAKPKAKPKPEPKAKMKITAAEKRATELRKAEKLTGRALTQASRKKRRRK